MWRWDQQEPFGNSPPDENPSGVGVFEMPLAFQGTYRDKETNLHYSYFRDCYDSGTGRFSQPDPIGTVLFERMAFRSLGTLGVLSVCPASKFVVAEAGFSGN